MISDWLPSYQTSIDHHIQEFFRARSESQTEIEGSFEEALDYAVSGGGKRLRTVLAAITYEYFSGQSMANILNSIIGIEMVHAYTLVHDDLPCMDNDEFRRGKPTVWKKYGETMAVLVGDTLQALGYELLAQSGDIRVIQCITRAMGDKGVVRGQVRDTMVRHDTLSLEDLLRIHDEKTGIFIAASLLVGGYLAGVSDDVIDRLRQFGMLLGRSFQIRDDILDIEGDISLVGKKIGKDVEAGKGIVSLLGLEASKRLLLEYEQNMYELIADWGDSRFRDIVSFVIYRQK